MLLQMDLGESPPVPLKNIHFNALQVELAEEIGESPIHSTPL
jgi:hypothetical protein